MARQVRKGEVRNLIIGIIMGLGLTWCAFEGMMDEAGINAQYLNTWCKVTGCEQKY